MDASGHAHVLMVVEDEEDIRLLIEVEFGFDSRFVIDGKTATAEEAIDLASQTRPDLVVLDHKLEGQMNGLEAAPLLKQAAPEMKIILFSASEELREPAKDEPSIDAFLLKTQIHRLVGLARNLLGLDGAQ